ncbi:Rrf2 family transcriptional regulator [Sulfurospirillum sp. T05]|uniref:Rrf2 family transcriptional regulator n=1 Tax=Sulfurospirillum tamanense TaxID=2813362 RepID=A0ABS2WRC1_9BACT|nr:Rrf2 family transcriptional regulator [Sulfurospirillum tamanensis]MBN2964180.1 Rrf2 family transcriptional regulator [Sulfurospirillum tamanensis]
MALISSKGAYGLRAMYELSLAQENTPVQIKHIAAKTGLSQNYLEQLLSILRRAGLVESIRGAHGGYHLAKPAEAIIVGEILEVLEGELQILNQGGQNDPLVLFYETCHERLVEIFNLPLSALQQYHERLLGQLHYTI